MTGARFCSECPNDISEKRPGTKTCSPKCRKARSLRLRAVKRRQQDLADYGGDVGGRIPAEIDEQIPNVINEELRPLVRESLNEDTLRSIQKLIGLSGPAIDALNLQLASSDEKIAQAAAKTILQYTVGHPALVSKEEDDGPKGLVVNFALPRPEGQPETIDASNVEDVDETHKVCDNCGTERPVAEFVSGSDRCVECWNAAQNEHQALLERTGTKDD